MCPIGHFKIKNHKIEIVPFFYYIHGKYMVLYKMIPKTNIQNGQSNLQASKDWIGGKDANDIGGRRRS